MMNSKFSQWFNTYINEKNPPYAVWGIVDSAGRTNIIDNDVVIEAIRNSKEAAEQAKIKDILIKIDFYNGDINHFFRQMAESMIDENPAVEVVS